MCTLQEESSVKVPMNVCSVSSDCKMRECWLKQHVLASLAGMNKALFREMVFFSTISAQVRLESTESVHSQVHQR